MAEEVFRVSRSGVGCALLAAVLAVPSVVDAGAGVLVGLLVAVVAAGVGGWASWRRDRRWGPGVLAVSFLVPALGVRVVSGGRVVDGGVAGDVGCGGRVGGVAAGAGVGG